MPTFEVFLLLIDRFHLFKTNPFCFTSIKIVLNWNLEFILNSILNSQVCVPIIILALVTNRFGLMSAVEGLRETILLELR